MTLVNKQKMMMALLSVGLGCSAHAATKTYQLQHFDQLVLAGHYQLSFTQAKQYVVSVTAKNLSDVQVSVSGNRLIVKQESHYSINDPLFQINIGAPDLTSANLSGHYQGYFVLPDRKQFSLNTQGQGDVSVTGKLNRFSVNSKGSLVVNTKNACAKAIDVQSAGTLNAIFCVDKNAQFDRMTIGQANITIYGQPMFGEALGFGAINIKVENQ
jgi:hypothetical protein